MSLYLFVYGTLMKKLRNHVYLENSEYIGPEHTEGILYDLGRAPAALESSAGLIHGEIYKVSEQTLKDTDRLEGHPDWYERKLRTFTVHDKTIEAWVYFMPAEQIGDDKVCIESGDWRQYAGRS